MTESSPEQSYLQHQYSDLNQGPQSQHHTLGGSPSQAAPGNHKHKIADVTDYTAPSSSLSYKVKVLGSAVTLNTSTYVDVIETDSLGIGTYLFNFIGVVNTTSSSALKIVAGTATATFTGVIASELNNSSSSGYIAHYINCIVNITAAGTVKIQGKTVASGAQVIITGSNFSLGNATGYTLVKIA